MLAFTIIAAAVTGAVGLLMKRLYEISWAAYCIVVVPMVIAIAVTMRILLGLEPALGIGEVALMIVIMELFMILLWMLVEDTTLLLGKCLRHVHRWRAVRR